MYPPVKLVLLLPLLPLYVYVAVLSSCSHRPVFLPSLCQGLEAKGHLLHVSVMPKAKIQMAVFDVLEGEYVEQMQKDLFLKQNLIKSK